MKRAQLIAGKWWIFGQGGDPHHGFLHLEDGEITLKISHPVIPSRTRAEIMVESTKEPLIQSTIYGRDSNLQPITLMNCLCTGDCRGFVNDENEIVAGICIRGQDIDSLDKPIIKLVSVTLDRFHRWLGTKFMALSVAEDQFSWIQPKVWRSEFELTSGVVLQITQITLSSESLDELSFYPCCTISLSFTDARSLNETIQEWVPCIVRFFTLLHGHEFRWSKMGFMVEPSCPFILPLDPDQPTNMGEGELMFHSSRTKSAVTQDLYAPWMITTYDKVQPYLPLMLSRWHDVHVRYKPVIELFWAVTFASSLYVEASFLFLVQALEAYHARCPRFDSKQLPSDEHQSRVEAVISNVPPELEEWVKRKILSSNYKHLEERLLDIFRENETILAEIFESVNTLAKRIAFTRNHLTHYSTKADSPRLLNNHEIHRVNDALERLLWTILLRECGLPESILVNAWQSLASLRGIREQ